MLVQVQPFLAQFEHALGDEGGLLGGIAAGHEHGLRAGFARGRELLGELVDVRGDGGVGDVQDLRRAAVVGFDLVDLRARIALGELEDVLEVRAAPGVDALRVVAHDHDVVMPRGEQVNEVALELVGVLVFVHEDELEAPLVMFAHVGVVLQQLEPEHEQVVEVHRIRGAFAGGVTLLHVLDLRRERVEVAVFRRRGFRRLALSVLTASEKMSPSTSALGKRVALTSMSASATQVLMRCLASSRSRMVKSRW